MFGPSPKQKDISIVKKPLKTEHNLLLTRKRTEELFHFSCSGVCIQCNEQRDQHLLCQKQQNEV